MREHNGFIDKYIGDAVMALFAGPADDALDAAIALQQAVRRFNEARARALQYPIAVGAGLHYGSLMLGTIGEERRLETTVIAGAVNVASRLEGLTKLFRARIIVSEAFATALQTPQRYHLRGLGGAHLAGLSADVGVYEVCDADEPEMLLAKMSSAKEFSSAVAAFCEGNSEACTAMFEHLGRQSPEDGAVAYFRGRASSKRMPVDPAGR